MFFDFSTYFIDADKKQEWNIVKIISRHHDWLLLWLVNKCFSNALDRGHWNVHLSINFWELVAIQSANSHKLSSWFNGLSICATTHKKSISTNISFWIWDDICCSSHKRHLTYNLNLIKQEMKMPKITNFFVPKIYSLFSCCAYSPFICSFIRCQTLNILFYVTFIQKGFCVMTFVRYQKKTEKKFRPSSQPHQ